MEQLRFTKLVAVMTFQSRKELNGEDPAPGATLHYAASVPAEMLKHFDPQLKASYYRKELKDEAPVQDVADEGTKPKDGLTRLKFTRSNNLIEWKEEFPNYGNHLDFGIADSAIKLEGVKADNFKFKLRDGGHMDMTWRVACHPNEAQAGKLYILNGREVTIDLVPPGDGANEGQGDMIGGGRK
jgi:hypothetical protein